MTDKFQCDICGVFFASKNLLTTHLDSHKQFLKCNVCGKNYKSLNNLKYHLKYHFLDGYFTICYLCGKPVSKWKLKRHIEHHAPRTDDKSAKDDKKYSCRFCGLLFNKINNRSSHEKRIHKTKSNLGLENFKCTECLTIFRTKEELRDHSFEHFKGKVHFCDFPGCSRYFKKGKLLTVHKRCHYEPQFKCLDCGAVFIQKSGLSKHQKDRCTVKKLINQPTREEVEKIASKAKEQFIELKGRIGKKASVKELGNKASLSKISHTTISSEQKTEAVPEEWQYEFLDEAMLDHEKFLLNSHVFVEEIDIQISTDENRNSSKEEKEYVFLNQQENNAPKRSNFICDMCGRKDIKTRNSLLKHLTSHVHKKLRRKLEHCQDAFPTKQHVVKHKDIFHGIKPDKEKIRKSRKTLKCYTCDYCGKQYWKRSSITTHLLITHKSVPDHNCTECCRKFKSHGNLVRHIRALHSNGKQFGCEKCGAMFKEKYQLEIHIHNHDEPTRCNLCGKMVSNIKVHLRHHASKPNNKLVKCPMCDKMIGKYQLIRHVKSVHEKQYQQDSTKVNLRVYSCKDCGDFFSRKQELRQHEYINHSQSKIYECNICGTYFKKLKLLNVHRFSHQPLNIACEICNKVYARKGALWKHQKKSHPEFKRENKSK